MYVGYFSILGQPNSAFRKACLRHLDSGGFYQRSGSEQMYSGSALMHAGLDLPYVSTTQDTEDLQSNSTRGQKTEVLDGGDFVSSLITLKKM